MIYKILHGAIYVALRTPMLLIQLPLYILVVACLGATTLVPVILYRTIDATVTGSLYGAKIFTDLPKPLEFLNFTNGESSIITSNSFINAAIGKDSFLASNIGFGFAVFLFLITGLELVFYNFFYRNSISMHQFSIAYKTVIVIGIGFFAALGSALAVAEKNGNALSSFLLWPVIIFFGYGILAISLIVEHWYEQILNGSQNQKKNINRYDRTDYTFSSPFLNFTHYLKLLTSSFRAKGRKS